MENACVELRGYSSPSWNSQSGPFTLYCRPGPNAPLPWVRDCVMALSPQPSKLRAKILLGLNFYGNDYSPAGGGRK